MKQKEKKIEESGESKRERRNRRKAGKENKQGNSRTPNLPISQQGSRTTQSIDALFFLTPYCIYAPHLPTNQLNIKYKLLLASYY